MTEITQKGTQCTDKKSTHQWLLDQKTYKTTEPKRSYPEKLKENQEKCVITKTKSRNDADFRVGSRTDSNTLDANSSPSLQPQALLPLGTTGKGEESRLHSTQLWDTFTLQSMVQQVLWRAVTAAGPWPLLQLHHTCTHILHRAETQVTGISSQTNSKLLQSSKKVTATS